MNRNYLKRLRVCLALALACPLIAAAQSFSDRPIRFVTPSPVAGSLDALARIVAEKLSPTLNTPIITDNRPGAAGVISAEVVARAAPDGHTLLVVANTLVIVPHLVKKIPYDTLKDFSPILIAATTANLILVNPSLPVRNIAELIALVRKTPGGMSYASGGVGSPMHLIGELFARTAKINLVHVPYKGLPAAHTDLISGQISLMVSAASAATPMVRSGKVVAIAVADPTRSRLFPAVPTISEQGVSGIDVSSWFCFLAPAGTPPTVIAKLNAEIGAVLKQADVIARLADQGIEATSSTPGELGRAMREDYARYGKVIADAKIAMQ